MKTTTLLLASCLLATGALLATPGAAAFQCDGFPGEPAPLDPGRYVDRSIACAEYMHDWVQSELDKLPPPDELLNDIRGEPCEVC